MDNSFGNYENIFGKHDENNECLRCRNSICVTSVDYGIGAIAPQRAVVPIPEKIEEYIRVNLEIHKLHVAAYEARQKLVSMVL